MNEKPSLARNRQEILDANALWERLYKFVVSAAPDESSTPELMTQELFLELMALGEFARYREAGLTENEINEELLSKLRAL